MIKAGIIGSTGYVGAELVRLLLQHPQAEIVWYGSRSYVDQKFSHIYRNMFDLVDEKCMNDNMDELAGQADVIFTATPQGLCASLINDRILEKAKIIDLSADFRLKRVDVYEKWYQRTHESPGYLPEAVYGLCEINRKKIASARLIANPGCYTTTSILTLYPLVAEGLIDPDTIIIDAKSGTSGAGRGAKLPNLFCEVNESIKPYGVATHRHTPEIEEQLSYAAGMDYQAGESVRINFTPHLVPMNRGILATCYASLREDVFERNTSGSISEGAGKAPKEFIKEFSKEAGNTVTEDTEAGNMKAVCSRIQEAYEKYYKDEYFIRLLGKGNFPETRWVEGSNFVDIGFTVDERTGRVIAAGSLDNLVKGAAGQAVQNMNILFGLPENTGLQLVPIFP